MRRHGAAWSNLHATSDVPLDPPPAGSRFVLSGVGSYAGGCATAPSEADETRAAYFASTPLV